MKAYLELSIHSTPELGWTYNIYREPKRGNWGMWAYGYSTKANAKRAATILAGKLGMHLVDVGDELFHVFIEKEKKCKSQS